MNTEALLYRQAGGRVQQQVFNDDDFSLSSIGHQLPGHVPYSSQQEMSPLLPPSPPGDLLRVSVPVPLKTITFCLPGASFVPLARGLESSSRFAPRNLRHGSILQCNMTTNYQYYCTALSQRLGNLMPGSSERHRSAPVQSNLEPVSTYIQ